MKKDKLIIGILAILAAAVASFFILASESALVTHPKGIIAQSQLDLIITNVVLMLIIIVPTYVLLFAVIWLVKRPNAKHVPRHTYKTYQEVLLWIIPCCIVAPMAIITWKATHQLDPLKPLESDIKPLNIQVVALDWKWLFIYPEQGIATLNFVEFPAGTPVRFSLAADSSPMNSFWIPQLSGQIYAMTGMVTHLHLMAHDPGEFTGRAAEINGEGYADMIFTVKSTTPVEFDDWVKKVKESPLKLNDSTYKKLLNRTIDSSVFLYSDVKDDFFNQIVMKYQHPKKKHYD
jgi:cytochrome o ubiquinol oxidase subunit 2